MNRRLLLVDDDPALVGLMGIALTREGWEVVEATSLRQAQSAEGPFACVIADVRLPNGDGRHLRETFPDVPFLVISGDPRERPDLAKPFTMRMLRDAVQQAAKP